MKHIAVKVENLMYKGCEYHWGCVICSTCVPFHCYTKEQFEELECNGIQDLTFTPPDKRYSEHIRKAVTSDEID